jgi:hypothetical protein
LVIDDPDGMGTQFIPVGRMCHEAAEALRARLAQPEPEPVAWGVPNTRPTEKAQFMMLLHSPDGCQYPEQLVPLYTAQNKNEWVGLTDAETGVIMEDLNAYGTRLHEFCRAIEAKLKDKNVV